jgi:hypothetical protein
MNCHISWFYDCLLRSWIVPSRRMKVHRSISQSKNTMNLWCCFSYFPDLLPNHQLSISRY